MHTVSDVYPADLASETNFFFDGEQAENSTGVSLTDESFVSLEPELPYQRDSEGTIIKGDFLQLQLPAEITLKPSVIKKKKDKGKKSGKKAPKLNVFIEFEKGIDLEKIDMETVRLDGDLSPLDRKPAKIGDQDKDGMPELKLQFSRSALAAKLEKGQQTISLDGELTSGLPFHGQAEILVK
ncbi:hypothetical protein [Sediminibacillus halophilus]|uniref:Uncharacterized protein n=1 Tax=Sediminibacillus halophilus TaxID=482461 RepID=A0A1G9N9W3_9BACI|nr:hypothetical protein [Sediminibacillus halophilus]SDL83101.1 hypothetical protein SAMN05216244_0905 [Sediminibacillus halophilus]